MASTPGTLNPEAFISEFRRPGPPWLLFVGSAISAPAPSLMPMLGDLKTAIGQGLQETPTASSEMHALVAELVEGRYKERWEGIAFELLMSYMTEVASDFGADFLSMVLVPLFTGGKPNANHAAIASLVRGGDIAGVLTTNFDELIEAALGALPDGKQRWRAAGETEGPQSSPRLPEALPKKLHGTVSTPQSLQYLMEQVNTRLPVVEARSLRALVSGHRLLFAGYSARDYDIAPELSAASATAPPAFWVAHGARLCIPLGAKLVASDLADFDSSVLTRLAVACHPSLEPELRAQGLGHGEPDLGPLRDYLRTLSAQHGLALLGFILEQLRLSRPALRMYREAIRFGWHAATAERAVGLAAGNFHFRVARLHRRMLESAIVPLQVKLRICEELGGLEMQVGAHDEARRVFAMGRRLIEQDGSAEGPAPLFSGRLRLQDAVAVARAVAADPRGRLEQLHSADEAILAVEREQERGRRLPVQVIEHARFQVSNARVVLAIRGMDGELQAAIEQMERANEEYRLWGSDFMRAVCQRWLAIAAGAKGNYAEASQRLSESLRLLELSRSFVFVYWLETWPLKWILRSPRLVQLFPTLYRWRLRARRWYAFLRSLYPFTIEWHIEREVGASLLAHEQLAASRGALRQSSNSSASAKAVSLQAHSKANRQGADKSADHR